MQYTGELYGKHGPRSYFPTGKTGADWDKLESERESSVHLNIAFHMHIRKLERAVREMDPAHALLPENRQAKTHPD